MFQAAAWLISQFYNLTSDYSAAIALVAVVPADSQEHQVDA
ncbi:MAG: hypothetical protein RL628_361 [Actinomycetota bacterium]